MSEDYGWTGTMLVPAMSLGQNCGIEREHVFREHVFVVSLP